MYGVSPGDGELTLAVDAGVFEGVVDERVASPYRRTMDYILTDCACRSSLATSGDPNGDGSRCGRPQRWSIIQASSHSSRDGQSMNSDTAGLLGCFSQESVRDPCGPDARGEQQHLANGQVD